MTFSMPIGTNRPAKTTLQKAFLIASFFYFSEVIFGGPGSWSSAHLGIDLRRVFFSLLTVTLLLNLITIKSAKMSDYLVLTFGVTAFLLWIIALPMFYGNNDRFAISDGSPLLYMFGISWLFIAGSKKWGDTEAILLEAISRFTFKLSLLLCILHIVIFALLSTIPDMGYIFVTAFKIFLDPLEAGSIFIGPMPDNSIRVFWISSLFILYGLYISSCALKKKFNIKNLILVLLFATALLITQTRSLLLAIPLGIIFATLLNQYIRGGNFSILKLSFIVASTFASVTFFQVAAASPEMIGFLGMERGGSDDERFLQIGPLIEAWSNNLLLGQGFGMQAAYIRSVDAPFSYEMSILALYMKIGLAGMLFIYSYIAYLVKSLIPSTASIYPKKFDYLTFFVCVFAFCFAFNTNPYLSNSVGVAIVLLCCFELKRLSIRAESDRP